MKLSSITNIIPANVPELTIAAKKTAAYTYGGLCKTMSLAGFAVGLFEGYKALSSFDQCPTAEVQMLKNQAGLSSICCTLAAVYLEQQSKDAFAYANSLTVKKVALFTLLDKIMTELETSDVEPASTE